MDPSTSGTHQTKGYRYRYRREYKEPVRFDRDPIFEGDGTQTV